jgi:hypothetical protein
MPNRVIITITLKLRAFFLISGIMYLLWGTVAISIEVSLLIYSHSIYCRGICDIEIAHRLKLVLSELSGATIYTGINLTVVNCIQKNRHQHHLLQILQATNIDHRQISSYKEHFIQINDYKIKSACCYFIL